MEKRKKNTRKKVGIIESHASQWSHFVCSSLIKLFFPSLSSVDKSWVSGNNAMKYWFRITGNSLFPHSAFLIKSHCFCQLLQICPLILFLCLLSNIIIFSCYYLITSNRIYSHCVDYNNSLIFRDDRKNKENNFFFLADLRSKLL